MQCTHAAGFIPPVIFNLKGALFRPIHRLLWLLCIISCKMTNQQSVNCTSTKIIIRRSILINSYQRLYWKIIAQVCN